MEVNLLRSWALCATRRRIVKSICYLAVLLTASCSGGGIIEKMEQIKTVGNNDPEKALVMLDSLELDIRDAGNYAKNKYDLLRIRLHDKANHMPSSDMMIKRLMAYFEEKGSIPEKQEAYYYGGSVYRDLQDTPRALENFFKSLDIALEHKECDPIMLRNTYSNLSYLFYMVQDYTNSVKYGIKELESCRQTGSDVIVPFMHLGAAYIGTDSLPQAVAVSDSAFAHIIHSGDFHRRQESILYLAYHYSFCKECRKAKECLGLLEGNPLEEYNPLACFSYAWYYEAMERYDSAAIYLERVLEDSTKTANMYEASKHLLKRCIETGDKTGVLKYAGIYMKMSTEIDFGKRQELAATVNNQYQYHLDQKKEQQLKDEKERYKQTLVIVSLLALLLACVGYILYVKRRNRHLKEVVALSTEKEQLLTEKTEQNKAFFKLLHQSEFEGKAEDVINAVRQASTGRRDMTAADWKQLFGAVDELYPSFRDRLAKELGTFTEQQMQICYLMRIGLTNPQIQNMTNLSRPTVWRRVKKYGWVLEAEDR